MKGIVLALSLAAAGAACGKKVQPPETVPAPKAQSEELSGGVAGSTTTSLLAAPGNYVRSTVGQVAKARAAKTLYEDSAKAQTKNLDLNETGGN